MNKQNLKTSSYLAVRLTILAILVATFFINKKARAQLENIITISSENSETKNYAGINSLMAAISENDVDGVNFFVKANPKLINEENVGGASPLHIAARMGNLEIVNILLASDANVNATDNEKWTALMRASITGNAEIVNALLVKNANILQTNNVGEGAIIHATMSECNQCLILLVNKAKSDTANLSNANSKQLISDQLTAAYAIAKNKQNRDSQAILTDFLSFITSLKVEKPINISLENSTKEIEEKTVKIIDASEKNSLKEEPVIVKEIALDSPQNNTNKTAKKFKFVKGEEGIAEPVKKHKNFKLKKPQVKNEVKPAETPKIQEQSSNDNLKFKFVKTPESAVKTKENLAPKTLATVKVPAENSAVKTEAVKPLEKVAISDEQNVEGKKGYTQIKVSQIRL